MPLKPGGVLGPAQTKHGTFEELLAGNGVAARHSSFLSVCPRKELFPKKLNSHPCHGQLLLFLFFSWTRLVARARCTFVLDSVNGVGLCCGRRRAKRA